MIRIMTKKNTLAEGFGKFLKAPRMKMKRMNDARQIRRAVWKYARPEIVRLILFVVLEICYFLLIALLLIDRISQFGLL